MLSPCRSLIASALFFLCAASARSQNSHYVDPFLGSEGGGNVFPGAALPFGMLKAGPDMVDGTGNAGWLAVGDIQGFSQTHVSGTGGGAKYGNILLQPTSGPLNPADHASPRLKEVSHPGLYEVTLGRYGIRVSIAAGSRSALYRFTYPASTNANLLFDVEHCLSSYPNQNEDQRVTSSHVRILSPTEIEGDSSVTGGWNQQTTSYTVYFYALADTAFAKSGTWRKSAVLSAKSLTGDTGVNSGAWMQFPSGTRTVHLKVGISFVSTRGARQCDVGVREL